MLIFQHFYHSLGIERPSHHQMLLNEQACRLEKAFSFLAFAWSQFGTTIRFCKFFPSKVVHCSGLEDEGASCSLVTTLRLV